MSEPTARLPLDAATIATDADAAELRSRPYLRETPLARAHALSRDTGADLWLKLDAMQVSGSFKARGAFNAVLALSQADRDQGIVTSSTGNHANAMAVVFAALGVEGEIVMPAGASPAKVDALRAKGTNLRLIDGDPGAVEVQARADAADSGRTFVSPYNDRQVIAGQGTLALELLRQSSPLPDVVLVPVGGGGLIAGIAGVLKVHAPQIQIIGVQPTNCSTMAQSVAAGQLIEPPWEPSLSDATVGWNEPGSITFEPCRDLVDDWVTVTEDEIAHAMRRIIGDESVLSEGAGALGVAAVQRDPERYAGRKVVTIVSGSRIPLEKLRTVLN